MNLYFSVVLSTEISNHAELIKRENPFEREAEAGRRKQEAPFSFSCLESSLLLKLASVWKATPSSTLLRFFSPRLTSPQRNTVWVTGFSSTIAPPPFSHWLFYPLIPSPAPSFPFSSPLHFLSFVSSFLCLHRRAHSPRDSVPPHTVRDLNQNHPRKTEKLLPRKLLLKSKGTETTSISNVTTEYVCKFILLFVQQPNWTCPYLCVCWV